MQSTLVYCFCPLYCVCTCFVTPGPTKLVTPDGERNEWGDLVDDLGAGVALDLLPLGLAGVSYNSIAVSGMLSPLPTIAETVGEYSGPCFDHNTDSEVMSDIADEDNLFSTDVGGGGGSDGGSGDDPHGNS